MNRNIRQDEQARIKDIEDLPEVQNMFDEIERLKGGIPEKKESEEIITEEPQYGEVVETEEGIPVHEIEEGVEENDYLDQGGEGDETVLNPSLKEKKSNKLKKLYNDRYQARVEKAEALQRVAELEAMLEESLSSGTYHYGKNVYAELDKAKQNVRQAFDEGDTDKHLDAQIALVKSVNAVNDLERWANENTPNNYNQKQAYQKVEYDSPAVQQEIVNDWLDTHPYLKINSKNFNPTIYGNVTSFISNLENNLQENDSINLIGTEEYFDTIDDYITSLKAPKRDNSKNIEFLSNVSGVRNSSTGNMRSSTSPERIYLSQDEKEIAYGLGVTEKEYAKYKYNSLKKSNNNDNDKRNNRYGK